jgi:phage terminase large subunit GpA-like protein
MMLWARSREYGYKRYTSAGSFPKDVLFLTSGADVHLDRIECEIKGWCRNGRSRSIEQYVFACKAGETVMDLSANCWKEYYEKVLNTVYLREDGLELGVAFNGIDRSYQPEIVQAFAESVDPKCERVIPLRGVDSQNAAISDLKISKMTYPGGVVKRVMYRDVGVSKLKGEAYSKFRLPYTDEGAACMFCEDYPPEVFDQLTVEEYVPGKNGKKGGWDDRNRPNHKFDCHIYNMAMWYYSGVPGWKKEDYDAHEAKLNALVNGMSDKKIAAKRYLGRQTFKPNLGL